MSPCEELFTCAPYVLNQKTKEAQLLTQLNALSNHHQRHCIPYKHLWRSFGWSDRPAESLEEVPYLPVGVFKRRVLTSVGAEEMYRTLVSSGTTSQGRSQVVLDRATAQRQAKALTHIMCDFLGDQRLPMLVIDGKESAITEGFSARQAGTLGMSLLGHSHSYVHDMEMHELAKWVLEHAEKSIFVFGFTHLVWQFLQRLPANELHLPNGILVHGGGWKKLQEQEVSRERFDVELFQKLGIKRCHNYYGMVEQAGSIFMGCEHGRLHCPAFAEVIFRDPKTWLGSNRGVIQVLSALPTSYPGHSLLTEDLGRLLGIDDCPCGRKGRSFEVLGRVPRAEMRGCSNV